MWILYLVGDDDKRRLPALFSVREDILHRGVGSGGEFRSGTAVLGGSADGGEPLIADFLDNHAVFLGEGDYLRKSRTLLNVDRIYFPARIECLSYGVFAIDQICFLIIHNISFKNSGFAQ